jgi:1-acyl-sn-glycerol-3-phosphate acyltransferase
MDANDLSRSISVPSRSSGRTDAPAASGHALRTPSVWRAPLPRLGSSSDRLLTRIVCRLALSRIHDVEGWKYILPERDPFVLVCNHSSRREALFLPALLLLARGGRPVRFLADWNHRRLAV